MNNTQTEIKTITERRLDAIEVCVENLKLIISDLSADIIDQKEAFEHTDDSVQKLRTTVSTLTGK